ncbi:MAG TPA: hypothetical protein IAB17_03785 [Candidatus Alectryocaccobium stercorigallinarum]|nr:hypothetical protein [Candidatus Alectryocaccobium stercorigallinarum]
MSRRRRKRKRTSPVVNIILIAIAVLCFAFIITRVFGENDKVAEQDSLFNITSAEDAAIIIDGEQNEAFGKNINGVLYIPYETVWNDINSGFYVEEAADTLFMTLPDQTLTWTVSDPSGYLYKDQDGTYYISAECVSQYSNIGLETYEDPYRIVIDTQPGSGAYVSVVNDSVIRVSASKKAEIAVSCAAGDVLELLSNEGEWSLVASRDGHFGYIQSADIAETSVTEEYTAKPELEFETLGTGGTIKMAWDYIGRPEDNEALDRMMEGTTGLNIISPTWFSISDTSGNLISYADAAYVEKAKNTYGLSVWALVGDYGGEDATTGEILQSYANRQNITAQLIESALTYGIDGINIDFEDIDEQYAPAYIEFLREFTQQAHMNGLIVSVDNYVPGYTDHYRRDAQNDIVDYVIMMGYDEHTAYTSEYGSVASLPYVEGGITATLEEVAPEKLVLAVPFYTRGFTVPFGTDSFETETLFMSDQETFMAEHGIENLTWDAAAGQYTGSSEDQSGRYYIWIENAESLAEKLSLVDKYSLAGACGWRLGMETDDIWPVWNEYLG